MATSNPKRGRAATGRVLVVETPPEVEGETEEKTEAEHAADEVLEETRAANPRGPEAIIYRLDPDTGEEKWIARVASSLVSHEWLAKKYGGGKYRVQHRKPNATGKLVFGGQETYTIDAAVRPEAMTAPIMEGAPGGGSRIDAIMEAGVMSLIQQMQNANTTQMELVRSIVAERANSKGMDWVGVLGAIAPIVTALIERTGEKKPDVMEQAKEIAELATKNQGAQGGLKDFIAAFREMMEVRDLIGGGGGDDNRSPAERLLEAAIPKFVELADRYAVHQAPQLPTPQAPGPIIGTPAQSAQLNAGTPQPTNQPMWLGFVSRKIPQWVKLAQMDKDPALYAALEMDNMPPMFMGPLRQFLQRDDAVDLVLAAYPALKEYETWAREFFDEISTLVLGDEEEEDRGNNEEEPDEEGDEETRRSADGSGEGSASRAVEEHRDSDESGITREDQRTPRRRNRARGRVE